MRRAISLASVAITQPQQKGETKMTNASKPADRISIFPVSCAIWRNISEGKVYFNATFEKSFRDASGKWATTSSFSATELLLLSKVSDLAHSRIIELRAKERQPEQEEEAA
jgi:hypothetical protein